VWGKTQGLDSGLRRKDRKNKVDGGKILRLQAAGNLIAAETVQSRGIVREDFLLFRFGNTLKIFGDLFT
jgi:hypothetical protein